MNIDFVFGDYRIIYEIEQDKLIILITKADNRGQIYKWNFLKSIKFKLKNFSIKV